MPVNRFESHLLRALDPGVDAVVVLNEEGRVVLSTSPRWLVGDRSGRRRSRPRPVAGGRRGGCTAGAGRGEPLRLT